MYIYTYIHLHTFVQRVELRELHRAGVVGAEHLNKQAHICVYIYIYREREMSRVYVCIYV